MWFYTDLRMANVRVDVEKKVTGNADHAPRNITFQSQEGKAWASEPCHVFSTRFRVDVEKAVTRTIDAEN
jgi:hypothetical protein